MKSEKVQQYFNELEQWKEELESLREIVLECGLIEELKWGSPTYMFGKTNVLILGGFKEHCVLSFIKGVLLKDELKKLVKPGENSQSVRFFKFKSTQEITKQRDLIKAYIFEAIELEKSGAKVDKTESKEFELPQELLEKFKENPALKTAFEALTIGRQRAYVIHFTGSKQSKTIQARIEKYIPRIMMGKGFNDCICGLSKRMPNCDGSHKSLQEN